MVPLGSSAAYTVTLTNATSAPITLTASRDLTTDQIVPHATVRITNHSGALILQVSRERSRLTPVYQITGVTLAPGQSLSDVYSFSSLFIEAGRYEASATFFTSEDAPGTSVGPLAVVAR